jgi:hypothetical protein
MPEMTGLAFAAHMADTCRPYPSCSSPVRGHPGASVAKPFTWDVPLDAMGLVALPKH